MGERPREEGTDMQAQTMSTDLAGDGAAQHGVSRRAFLIRTALTGAATLLGSVALASPASAQVAPSGWASLEAAQDAPWAPSPVTLVYADSADVTHIDPAL